MITVSRSAEMMCNVNGCANSANQARGWCRTHYARWQRHGDPNFIANMQGKPLAERLWSNIKTDGECWVWKRGKTRAGYGTIGYFGKTYYTHRLSYELMVGPIPDGLELDHLCFNRLCCNPWHLEPVTSEVNKRRMLDRNTKMQCPQGHPYEGSNVIVELDGSRRCRACRKAYDRKRHSAKAVK